jgi:hypothetical protein
VEAKELCTCLVLPKDRQEVAERTVTSAAVTGAMPFILVIVNGIFLCLFCENNGTNSKNVDVLVFRATSDVSVVQVMMTSLDSMWFFRVVLTSLHTVVGAAIFFQLMMTYHTSIYVQSTRRELLPKHFNEAIHTVVVRTVSIVPYLRLFNLNVSSVDLRPTYSVTRVVHSGSELIHTSHWHYPH